MTATAPRRSAISRALLGLCVALLATNCGQSGAEPEESPGALRIAKAVMLNLFTNTIEAKPVETPEKPEDAAGTAPAPAPAPAVYALAEAELPQTCATPYNGPVTIVPVRTANALQRSVANRPPRELVYETEDTAIFEDGYVLTTELETVGTHLNAVGWSTNPMQIMGAGVRPGGSAANTGWRSADASGGQTAKKKKKRRRG